MNATKCNREEKQNLSFEKVSKEDKYTAILKGPHECGLGALRSAAAPDHGSRAGKE